MYNITFQSTNITLENQSLTQTLNAINEHYANVGYDPEEIIITSATEGNIIEIITSDNVQSFEKVLLDKFNEYYTISSLIQLLPYLN